MLSSIGKSGHLIFRPQDNFDSNSDAKSTRPLSANCTFIPVVTATVVAATLNHRSVIGHIEFVFADYITELYEWIGHCLE